MKEYQIKEKLEKSYETLGSLSKVAKHYNVSKKTILNYMNKFKIPRNSITIRFDEESLLKRFSEGENIISIAESLGVSVPTVRKVFKKHKIDTDRFHKGYILKDSGYILIRKPEHPNSDKKGYVLYHRLIVEEHIGRYLSKEEVVHHIDFDKNNNNITNLQILNPTTHAEIHSRMERKVIDIYEAKRMIDNGVKRIEVANKFGISTDTLRAKLKRYGLYKNDKI